MLRTALLLIVRLGSVALADMTPQDRVERLIGVNGEDVKLLKGKAGAVSRAGRTRRRATCGSS